MIGSRGDQEIVTATFLLFTTSQFKQPDVTSWFEHERKCQFVQKRWIISFIATCKNRVGGSLRRWYVGFQHTAFSFAYESMVADTKVYDEYLPPGSLVTLLQKALQYIEMESHVHIVDRLSGTDNL